MCSRYNIIHAFDCHTNITRLWWSTNVLLSWWYPSCLWLSQKHDAAVMMCHCPPVMMISIMPLTFGLSAKCHMAVVTCSYAPMLLSWWHQSCLWLSHNCHAAVVLWHVLLLWYQSCLWLSHKHHTSVVKCHCAPISMISIMPLSHKCHMAVEKWYWWLYCCIFQSSEFRVLSSIMNAKYKKAFEFWYQMHFFTNLELISNL